MGASGRGCWLVLGIFAGTWLLPAAEGGVLDKQAQLEAQTFWDNQDWDWYKANIPFFECPDADMTTIYYYRWDLVTKHLVYGSPNSGYSYTEFMDRPFWSGAYGAISCPAGHQLYEVRWLADARLAQDYARYWLRTPGAQPRNYSTWLADSVWAVHLAHRDEAFAKDLLADLIRNHEGWEKRHFVPAVGMYWQIGHDDGMEFNIASRQTRDIFRGAPGFRPSFNAYMWADLQAIARIADLAGEAETAKTYRAKADALKAKVQALLWDPKRNFFFQMFKNDEECDPKKWPGQKLKAGTLTYQDGPFAGDPHGRELIGYVPWAFNLVDAGYESAWQYLMPTNRFMARFGPSFVERNDPLFLVTNHGCWWSGQSWPYANTQVLKALANLLQNYKQDVITRADYLKVLQTYTATHRKNGKPYLAEAANPDTGSWEGYDGYNHSEHYFHSGYTDLIVTGLAGVKPRADDTIEIDPLAPADWPWFALDDVPYHGRRVSVIWDKDGTRYKLGSGLHLLIDGKQAASARTLGRLTAKMPPPPARPPAAKALTPVNYAVNNDGTYFPRMAASFTAKGTSLTKACDGQAWYLLNPPNRWTAEGSTNAVDWIEVDLGTNRTVHTAKLYLLDDGEKITVPQQVAFQYWDGRAWKEVPRQTRVPARWTGKRANTITFPELAASRFRAVLTHGPTGKSGLSEFEVWGAAQLPLPPPPALQGNLAYNPTSEGFPKASASFADVFGGQPKSAIDGRIVQTATPMNRWTSYGSPNPTDWLEIDFGAAKTVGRIEIHLYDDRGGVQTPEGFVAQVWDGAAWTDAPGQVKTPAAPSAGEVNVIAFPPVKTAKVRLVFTHKGNSRSGATEVLIFEK